MTSIHYLPVQERIKRAGRMYKRLYMSQAIEVGKWVQHVGNRGSGRQGKVLEIKDARARVIWSHFMGAKSHGVRTWVRFQDLMVIPPVE